MNKRTSLAAALMAVAFMTSTSESTAISVAEEARTEPKGAVAARRVLRLAVLADQDDQEIELIPSRVFADGAADVTVLGWRDLRDTNLSSFDVVVIGSRMYKKDINGASAYAKNMLEAVRNAGTGLVVLNDLVQFKGTQIPKDWVDLALTTVIPQHADKVPEFPMQKLVGQFDPELRFMPIDTQHPERRPIADFLLVGPRVSRGRAAGAFAEALGEYAAGHEGAVAFGWFDSLDGALWNPLVSGRRSDGAEKTIAIEASFGKGRVLFSTMLFDAEAGADPRGSAARLYRELIRLAAEGRSLE